MPRVYLTGSGPTRGYITGSGVLNNPPRTILRLRDNATGSYPATARSFMPGRDPRTGRYASTYNDTKTIIFAGTGSNTNSPGAPQIVYPFGLTTGSAYVNQSISTPNLLGESPLVASGTVRSGIADDNISFAAGQDLTPFVEDGLFSYDPKTLSDPFWLTGSQPKDVGLGFTHPLRDKTRIDIDLNPSTYTLIGLVEAETSDSAPNNLMAYYNFKLSRWEEIGRTVNLARDHSGGTAVSFRDFFDRACLGFSRGNELMISGVNEACRPITNFGFPIDARYHATSSQTFPLSGVLNLPFVLEKYVYTYYAQRVDGTDGGSSFRSDMFRKASNSSITNYSAGTNQSPSGDRLHRASIDTFFILNQRRNANAETYAKTHVIGRTSPSFDIAISSSIPGYYTLSSKNGSTPYDAGDRVYVDTTRDLVTYGQSLAYRIQGSINTLFPFQKMFEGGLKREVNFVGDDSADQYVKVLVMSGTAKQSPAMSSSFLYRVTMTNPSSNIDEMRTMDTKLV